MKVCAIKGPVLCSTGYMHFETVLTPALDQAQQARGRAVAREEVLPCCLLFELRSAASSTAGHRRYEQQAGPTRCLDSGCGQ